ncbi:MAG: hypothetical protein A2259_02650 [Candidatus Moranbacteria bacterium RIFOXYA2_FULL_43_15]|nr:MAG: hypothetical protein A2259_02650 [Candidatus Moranbacteria bacterium RIFOXYA2_FULL_43_15]
MADIGMNTGLEETRRMHDTAVFERARLENGVSVWLQKTPILTDDGGIIIALFSGIGSRMDPPGEAGMAHFFEHMPFKGTKDKPSPKEVSSPIENRGGVLNANTSQLRTTYYAETAGADFELALDTLFQVVAHPLIRKEDVAKERGPLLEEYKRVFRDGDSVAAKYFLEEFAGRNHSLGHLPIGEIKTIENMTKEKLDNFYTKHYHAGNLHIICGGSFSRKAGVLGKISDYFSLIAKNHPNKPAQTDPDLLYKSGRVVVNDSEFKRDMLISVITLPRLTALDHEAVDFLAAILSRGSDSFLNVELRENRGWVYEQGLTSLSYSFDTELFTFKCPTSRVNFRDAEEILYDSLAKLDADYIVRRQKSRQMERATTFKHPARVCHSIVDEIVLNGQLMSYRETEDLEDSLTVERILQWRDYLLDKPSFILEALA